MPRPTDAMVAEAQRGLEWRREFGRGGTQVGVSRARDIVNRRDLSLETLRRMRSYFARHEVDKQGEGWARGDDGYPSAGRIAWALWGGDAGRAFADRELRKAEAMSDNYGSAQLEARLGARAESSDDDDKRRRYRMTAYTGDAVELAQGRVVFDLAGLAVPDKAIPILRQHDAEQIVGYSERIEVTASDVVIDLVVSTATAAGREVVELMSDDFPWQASVGLTMNEIEVVEDDEVEVNGRAFEAPIAVVRSSTLKEASFVPLGADAATSVAALSAFLDSRKKDEQMTQNDQSAPDAAEIRAAEMRRLAELKSAFPNDPEFAIEQWEQGASLTEAKAAFADVLLARQAAAAEAHAAELEAAKSAARAEAAEQVGFMSPTAQAASSDAGFEALVAAKVEQGKTRWQAVRSVALAHPDAHIEFLKAANGGINPLG
mgnify:CR=1 FL=1